MQNPSVNLQGEKEHVKGYLGKEGMSAVDSYSRTIRVNSVLDPFATSDSTDIAP